MTQSEKLQMKQSMMTAGATELQALYAVVNATTQRDLAAGMRADFAQCDAMRAELPEWYVSADSVLAERLALIAGRTE